MTTSTYWTPPATPNRTDLRATLWLAATAAALLIGIASYAAHPTVADESSTSAVLAARPLPTLAAPATVAPAASTCWVPGDLIGDANPASVTAAACSSRDR